MSDFSVLFKGLTGHNPFPWQEALYVNFIDGKFPDSASIPTGLGKTSVIAIWLIALVQRPDTMPRRLVYVVNRRTVVDQTTAEVEKMRQGLIDKPELTELAASLRSLCALPLPSPESAPLAISTLRGQYADNGEWRMDPARPAVIIGTVDMIGSGLLFSRYTAGFKTRPFHAALLGQDAFLIHDEAHLEPAFQLLIEEITATQQNSDLRPLKIMALTATSRSDTPAFGLTDRDIDNSIVQDRFCAAKKLVLLSSEKPETDIIVKAREFTVGNILIFVRSVESALRIARELDKKERKGRVVKLTGTMRGKERDELVNDPRFQNFLPAGIGETPSDALTILVATSAGEVGVNISADHLVCDLSTYESMVQRFGRVNRFGQFSNSTITVYHEPEFGKRDKKTNVLKQNPIDIARELTLELLNGLAGCASPAAFKKLEEKVDTFKIGSAFSPSPKLRTATEIQFDAWALTSIREHIPARPPVAPYLHGEEDDWQPHETYLAWRNDLDFDHISDPADFLEEFPLRAHELLRDTTKRIVATLKKMLKDVNEIACWRVGQDGFVSIFTVSAADKNLENKLAECTLILPASFGGLEDGLFIGKGVPHDVSGILRRESTSRESADYCINITQDDSEDSRWLLWFKADEGFTQSAKPQQQTALSLEAHQKTVTDNACAIAAKLNLAPDLQIAIAQAARHHDDGKARRAWQLAIGNRDYPKTTLAKSAPNMSVRTVAENYRHEFGSLTAEVSPLAAHIIAAHHGRARPYFPTAEVFDPESSPTNVHNRAAAVPLRFAALQSQYGRWGLAYLESILRAADYAASAGIVAPFTNCDYSDMHVAQGTTTPDEQKSSFSILLDPTNPGHYFACCGLFELASRLAPGSMGTFSYRQATKQWRFEVTAKANQNNQPLLSVSDLLSAITNAEITALDTNDKPLSPLFLAEPFNLRLDWWRYEKGGLGKLKTWAGQMNVHSIAVDMQQTLKQGLKQIHKCSEEILIFSSAHNIGQPFCFDAINAVNAKAQDVGFSMDRLSKGGVKFKVAITPAVELLCLIGLQRMRPILAVNERGKERLYDYHLWTNALPVSLLSAVSKVISAEDRIVLRFANPSRGKDYRAFMPAILK